MRPRRGVFALRHGLMLAIALVAVYIIALLMWRQPEPPPPQTPPVDKAYALATEPLVTGLVQPTDLSMLPGSDHDLIVLEKAGRARWFDLRDGRSGEFFSVDVPTDVELGLLGIAFSPAFATNGLFFVHHSMQDADGRLGGVVAAYRALDPRDPSQGAERVRDVLVVAQPYANHNGGQLAFGPDKMLYAALGDGGLAWDPHGNGQDRSTLLGSILRLDVSDLAAPEPYLVPRDNPFVGRADMRGEIWAYGLRNPWRFTFAPDGRMVVADVGQDRWEEIDLVPRGANLGWRDREGRECTRRTACPGDQLDPIYVYGHDQGVSVTGGVVYTGTRLPADLRGRYLFADFGAGWIRALTLPDTPGQAVAAVQVFDGGFPISAFARDADGEVLIADFTGRVVRLIP